MRADPLEVVSSTAEAAFATDEEGRVVIWNRAAERLLGHDAARVLGKPCDEILCGLDVFGNRYCDEDCALKQMARRREAVHHFEIDIRRASGETFRASFSVVVIPGPRPSQYTLVHLFRPVDRGREGEELVRRILKASPAPSLPALAGAPPRSAAQPAPLTAREIEVLHLMANGGSTSHIADSLFISQATVRNHTQNILRKLEVHSKLEAVSLALRSHLI
jgi:PAS domain S-box-containing protein